MKSLVKYLSEEIKNDKQLLIQYLKKYPLMAQENELSILTNKELQDLLYVKNSSKQVNTLIFFENGEKIGEVKLPVKNQQDDIILNDEILIKKINQQYLVSYINRTYNENIEEYFQNGSLYYGILLDKKHHLNYLKEQKNQNLTNFVIPIIASYDNNGIIVDINLTKQNYTIEQLKQIKTVNPNLDRFEQLTYCDKNYGRTYTGIYLSNENISFFNQFYQEYTKSTNLFQILNDNEKIQFLQDYNFLDEILNYHRSMLIDDICYVRTIKINKNFEIENITKKQAIIGAQKAINLTKQQFKKYSILLDTLQQKQEQSLDTKFYF